MNINDFHKFFRVYLNKFYGLNSKWTIQKTKVVKTSYSSSEYTMFISDKDDKPLAISEPQLGYRINSWSASQYATFITTLKPVEI